MRLVPKPKTNKQKYNTDGWAQKEMFMNLNINEEFAMVLAGSTNLALSENSKSQYKTAARHIQGCEDYLNEDMSLPFTIGKTLKYVGYLFTVRGVKASTVNQYLSAIRMLHLCQNHDPQCLRPQIVSLILKGREHWENIQNTLENKPHRVAVTTDVMKYIKRRLSELEWPVEKKLRMWAVPCLLWNGSLRVHEALSKTQHEFDPQVTLLAEDLILKKLNVANEQREVIEIHLKSPKEQRVGTGIKLEIFDNKTFLCPVRALKKWRAIVGETVTGCPLFRDETGLCYTGANFNKDLSEITNSLTEGTKGLIKPHSFRSGLATEMAQRGRNEKIFIFIF